MIIDAGETRDFIPGSSAELELELDPSCYIEFEEDEQEETEWRPLFLINIAEVCYHRISCSATHLRLLVME